MAIPLPFVRRPQQAPPQGYVSHEDVKRIVEAERQQRDMALAEQARAIQLQQSGDYPRTDKTKEERYLAKILDPHVPEGEDTQTFYSITGDSSIHFSLTNIPDPWVYQRLRRSKSDLFRIFPWQAHDYFKMRQMNFLFEAFLLKSISYTPSSREREQLNEARNTTTIRDDRTQQPRESHSLVGGFLSR